MANTEQEHRREGLGEFVDLISDQIENIQSGKMDTKNSKIQKTTRSKGPEKRRKIEEQTKKLTKKELRKMEEEKLFSKERIEANDGKIFNEDDWNKMGKEF